MLLKLCSPDQAAQEIIGAEKAYSQDYPEDQIRVSFSAGDGINANQHKRKDSERENTNEKVSYLWKAGKPN
jgi:predicted component of type VI protein secretion system